MTVAEKALPHWGLQGGTLTVIAARENTVYKVDHDVGTFALRLHRKGYRTDSQLAAELDWMAWLDRCGLSVPAPVPSLTGAHLQHVDGTQVDVLTWLQGETIDTALPKLSLSAQCGLFRQLGETIARLHDASDRWPGAASCDRPAWDKDGLLGEAPLWDCFWGNPDLTPPQRKLMSTFRATASADLERLAPSLDYGLIHSDLVPVNLMWTGEALHLIDFDDGGFGFRLFELATALLKHRAHPSYPILKDSLIDAYAAVRPIDTRHLTLFMALRAATYVGWNMTRMNEDGAEGRNDRFINSASALAYRYIEHRG